MFGKDLCSIAIQCPLGMVFKHFPECYIVSQVRLDSEYQNPYAHSQPSCLQARLMILSLIYDIIIRRKQQQKEQISYNKEEFTTVQEDDACSGVESQVMDLARSYQQFVVYKWFSHVWGSSSGGINDVTRPHHHTSIIQNVIPTRTGLSLLRTKTVVYEAVTGTTVKEL